MMDKELFAHNLKRISVNFSNISFSDLYISVMFKELNNFGFNDKDFLQSVNSIIDNEKTLFQPPSKALFIHNSDKKPLTDDEQANIEVERMIEAAEFYGSVIFDNEFTNAAIDKYGGIGKLHFELFDDYNLNKTGRNWIKRELKEIWLNCKITSNKSCRPSCIKGSMCENIRFIGNKEKCQNLLNNYQLVIEDNSKPIGKCLSIGEIVNNNSNINL
jgi:hypothetical protein